MADLAFDEKLQSLTLFNAELNRIRRDLAKTLKIQNCKVPPHYPVAEYQ